MVAMGVTTSDYVDNGLTNGTQYSYVVTAFDNESKESGYSNEAADTPFESRIHSYSSTQDGNEPKNILDGDVSDDSRWSAQTFPQWVIVDYGRPIWIKGTRIWTYQNRAYQFTIEASLVPTSDYIPIVDRSANTDGTQPISDDFSSVSARYLRLTITGASGYTGDWCSITEFQIVEGEPNPDFLEPVGVGLEDFAYLAGYWQRSNCSSVNNGYCFGADLNHSGQVDIMDLGLFVEWWLQDPMTVGQ